MRIYDCEGSLIHDLRISDPVYVSDWTLWLWQRAAELGGGDDGWRAAVDEMHRAVALKVNPPEPELYVLPAPEVRSRPAAGSEVPKGARDFINTMMKAEWRLATFYSRGPVIHARSGRALRMADVIGVRGERRGHDGLPGELIERCAAVWQDGKSDGAWYWLAGDMPRKMGVQALLAQVAEKGQKGV